MSVLLVGASHRTAPVALLERLSLDGSGCQDVALALHARPSLSEAIVLATCNRFEVYVMAAGFHPGVQDVVDVLHRATGVDVGELRSHVYVRYADAAAEHLMTVTAGLDSMVPGEQQVIGQVRTAYQLATAAGTVGPALHGLAQAALRAGKRVHAETAVDEVGPSMVTYALDEAVPDAAGPGALAGRTALVLGAGAMASLAAAELGRRGISRLIVANRTRDRAEHLAAHARDAGVDTSVVDFADRAAVLMDRRLRVDLVVSATGSRGHTLDAEDLLDPPPIERTLVDLSMPADIDPRLAHRPGMRLVNIDSLQRRRRAGAPMARVDPAAQAIVAEELNHYTSSQRVREVAPAVTALRKRAGEVTESELAQLRSRVPDMTEEDFAAVTRTVQRVVDKLLHEPTVRAKQLAERSSSLSYDSALPVLFGLSGFPGHVTEEDRSVTVDGRCLPLGDFQRRTCPLPGCNRALGGKETA